ncbi:MAG: precorrin-8X methylmutase [Pseudomonadota bacterium]
MSAARFTYERDPQAIYAQSFACVTREANLSRFAPDARELAIRVIHACGMVEIADDLVVTDACVAAGRAALAAGRPVLCDAQMVVQGIIRRGRTSALDVRCTLNDERVPELAAAIANTRSAAAVDLWESDIAGAIVAIGNAPTALFRLLEHLRAGWPKPACVLAFPVGFVGAAESKAALIASDIGVPYATLPGRRGGSAMASAAVNALTIGLDGDRA